MGALQVLKVVDGDDGEVATELAGSRRDVGDPTEEAVDAGCSAGVNEYAIQAVWGDPPEGEERFLDVPAGD